MISLVRPAAEPAALNAARTRKHALAKNVVAGGGKPDLDGYDVAKEALFEMQYRKCCYCERLEPQAKYRDVEHYRPKSAYWWLAWTWENLLFACFECNREWKHDQFPVGATHVALESEELPPGGEAPLLIDPAGSLDPLDHIEFKRERIQRHEHWRPWGKTEIGRETIRVCGLDRPALLTDYVWHVTNVVRPRLEPFFAATARNDEAQAVVKAWSTATRALLAHGQPFRALSFDALATLRAREWGSRAINAVRCEA